MIVTALQSVLGGVREFFLLEKAEQSVAALGRSRQDTLRLYYEAASRRLNVAQDLRGPVQTSAALSLYREGTHFLALAYLASRGHLNIDPASATIQQSLQELDKALEAEGVDVRAAYSGARSWLVSADPLDFDRLNAAEAARRVEQLEEARRWLSALIDARSPAELRWTRVARIGAAVVVALALVALLWARVTAPKNLALGKPTNQSSVNLGTTGAGVVDGLKTGTFGYHSDLDESPWVSIDLGRPTAISSVKVFGRGDNHYDQSIPLVLEASDDGTNYQQVVVRNEPFSEYDPWVAQPVNLVTRFVRLRTLRRAVLVLGEVEVYGSPRK